MSIKSFIENYRQNYWHWFLALSDKGLMDWIPDRYYLKAIYRSYFGKRLDLKNPKAFTEKLQWLKLNDRKHIYTTMVDKYEVKSFMANVLGNDFIIPTLGVWDSFDDINFSKLPNQFVLKCTHDSGRLIVVTDKANLDIDSARNKIEKCLKYNFYKYGREWPYKDVKPRIIAEQYLEDLSGEDLRDYKFFCFNGEVKCFKVDFDRFIDHRANYYDKNNNILHFGEADYPPVYSKRIVLPESIEKMKELAETLSSNCPFLRVDFYDVNGKIFFGELTFYPASGFGKYTPNAWDLKLGEWLDL